MHLHIAGFVDIPSSKFWLIQIGQGREEKKKRLIQSIFEILIKKIEATDN